MRPGCCTDAKTLQSTAEDHLKRKKKNHYHPKIIYEVFRFSDLGSRKTNGWNKSGAVHPLFAMGACLSSTCFWQLIELRILTRNLVGNTEILELCLNTFPFSLSVFFFFLASLVSEYQHALGWFSMKWAGWESTSLSLKLQFSPGKWWTAPSGFGIEWSIQARSLYWDLVDQRW